MCCTNFFSALLGDGCRSLLRKVRSLLSSLGIKPKGIMKTEMISMALKKLMHLLGMLGITITWIAVGIIAMPRLRLEMGTRIGRLGLKTRIERLRSKTRFEKLRLKIKIERLRLGTNKNFKNEKRKLKTGIRWIVTILKTKMRSWIQIMTMRRPRLDNSHTQD